jgi:hypothetical protein
VEDAFKMTIHMQIGVSNLIPNLTDLAMIAGNNTQTRANPLGIRVLW